MSKIGKNIKKIRTVKKLSQASFAKLFNLARPSIGAYEEGRAEPKIETIMEIANYFNLSIDSVLTKDLTINDLYRFDSLKKKTAEQPEKKPGQPPGGRMNARYVSAHQYLDYIHHFKNHDFIDNLPAYHLPQIKSLSARVFKINDEAMSFQNEGILPGDLIACEKKIHSIDELHTGQVYILVLQDNILLRRLSEINKKLKFAADNPDWQHIFYAFENILEIWEASSLLTKNLYPPLQIDKRINILEEKVDILSKQLISMQKSIAKNKPSG